MKTGLSREESNGLIENHELNTGSWHSTEVRDGDESQAMGARVFVPDSIGSPDEIIIDDIAFSVHASKPRDVLRSGLLAQESRLVTVALEHPAISPSSGPLTTAQRRALSEKGDWSQLGKAKWEIVRAALAENDIDLEGKTVHFTSFSMGVSSTVGMVTSAPEDVRTGHFIAWEGTAWVPKTGIKRLARVGGMIVGMIHGGIGLAKYQKSSPDIPDSITVTVQNEIASGKRQIIKHKLGQKVAGWCLPVWSMAAGRDAENLRDALVGRSETETAKVHIWHGEKSLLSRRKANEYGAELLRRAGISVDLQHDEDGRHGVEDALPLAVRRYVDAIQSPL